MLHALNKCDTIKAIESSKRAAIISYILCRTPEKCHCFACEMLNTKLRGPIVQN